jgi:hypothetical protein
MRTTVQAGLSKNEDPISPPPPKENKAKRAGMGMSQIVEFLPNKHEVLISNSNITRKKVI